MWRKNRRREWRKQMGVTHGAIFSALPDSIRPIAVGGPPGRLMADVEDARLTRYGPAFQGCLAIASPRRTADRSCWSIRMRA